MSPTSYLAAPPRVKNEKQNLSNCGGFVNMLWRFSTQEFTTKNTELQKTQKKEPFVSFVILCFLW
jgi:hypothetical protein